VVLKGEKMRKEYDLKKMYFDDMKVRYAMPDMSTIRGSGAVVDSYYPTMACSGNDYPKNIRSATACCISPSIAIKLGLRAIPILELVKMLGYTERDIKAILLGVKAKKESLYLIGAGGTSSNFIHWTNEMCILTNTLNIFEEMIISDSDNFSLTNIPRIPMHIQYTSSIKKSMIMKGAALNLSTKIEYHTSTTAILHMINKPGHLYYGAPDIETRDAISINNRDNEQKIRFVSATHGGDNCLLQVVPLQDSSLQVESYGLVDLSFFFMNHIKMTIRFLKAIADGEDFTETREILEYSFRDTYEADALGSTKKTYRFTAPKQENLLLDVPTGIEGAAND